MNITCNIRKLENNVDIIWSISDSFNNEPNVLFKFV